MVINLKKGHRHFKMGVSLIDMPNEILTNIASNLNAQDTLSLSTTRRSIRAGCLDSLLFKDLIERQHTLWSFHSLNLDRIARRIHQDASVLARYKYFDLDASRTAHWDKGALNSTIRQYFGLDLRVWMRYAMADYKAYVLCEQLNGNLWRDGHPCLDHINEPKILDALQYLPNLLTLKRKIPPSPWLIVLSWMFMLTNGSDPCIHASGLAPALMTKIVMPGRPSRPTNCDYPSKLDLELDPRLAFSFCAAMLSQDTPEIPLFRMSSPKAALERFLVNRCKLIELNLQLASERERYSSAGSEPAISQADAQVLLGAFSAALRRAFREYRIRRLIGMSYYTFVLPFALDIPLVSDTDRSSLVTENDCSLPVPFATASGSPANESWEYWHTSHIAALSKPEAISTGTWVGSYSYNTCAGISISSPSGTSTSPDFDAPMQSISFTVTPDGALLATGHDSIGAFTLAGSISPDGAIRARKVYAGPRGPRWEWWARVTPWGITGVWGPLTGEGMDERTPTVSGALWLWKEAWTAGRAP